MVPASRRYKVRPYAIKTHEVVVICGGSTLAEFCSTADYSTTVTGIPIRIAGSYWARRQHHAGIKYVPVASKLRISLASLEGVHLALAEFYLMAYCSTSVRGIPILIAGGCWA